MTELSRLFSLTRTSIERKDTIDEKPKLIMRIADVTSNKKFFFIKNPIEPEPYTPLCTNPLADNILYKVRNMDHSVCNCNPK